MSANERSLFNFCAKNVDFNHGIKYQLGCQWFGSCVIDDYKLKPIDDSVREIVQSIVDSSESITSAELESKVNAILDESGKSKWLVFTGAKGSFIQLAQAKDIKCFTTLLNDDSKIIVGVQLESVAIPVINKSSCLSQYDFDEELDFFVENRDAPDNIN